MSRLNSIYHFTSLLLIAQCLSVFYFINSYTNTRLPTNIPTQNSIPTYNIFNKSSKFSNDTKMNIFQVYKTAQKLDMDFPLLLNDEYIYEKLNFDEKNHRTQNYNFNPASVEKFRFRQVNFDLEPIQRDASGYSIDSFPKSFHEDKNYYKLLKKGKETVHRFLAMIQTIERKCRKMSAMGGRSCKRVPDGEKYICLDPRTKLNPERCLVLSFGVGHDFSFEREMGVFGCHVFAFDDDSSHAEYPAIPFDRVYFSRIRLGGPKVMVSAVSEIQPNGSAENFVYTYRPIDNIIAILEVEDIPIDYLKVDIEGQEWEVFRDSIFQTDVLNRTRFLAVETHFSNILNTSLITDLKVLQDCLLPYMSFFQTLHDFGFQLIHYEPNYVTPVFTSMLHRLVPVYAELVWYNPGAPPGKQIRFRRPADWFVEQIEKL